MAGSRPAEDAGDEADGRQDAQNANEPVFGSWSRFSRSGSRRQRQLAFSPGARNRPPEEREADEFMAAFLAPRHVLFLGVALAAEQSSLPVWDVVRRANTAWGLHVWRHSMLPNMIDRLCLSREFIAVQMSKWCVFAPETVEYHKTYRLPNRWQQ
jgi:hypothetical protein